MKNVNRNANGALRKLPPRTYACEQCMGTAADSCKQDPQFTVRGADRSYYGEPKWCPWCRLALDRTP